MFFLDICTLRCHLLRYYIWIDGNGKGTIFESNETKKKIFHKKTKPCAHKNETWSNSRKTFLWIHFCMQRIFVFLYVQILHINKKNSLFHSHRFIYRMYTSRFLGCTHFLFIKHLRDCHLSLFSVVPPW